MTALNAAIQNFAITMGGMTIATLLALVVTAPFIGTF